MITSITTQTRRDGRPDNICWCGYPKSVCLHGPEVKSLRRKRKANKSYQYTPNLEDVI